MKPRETVDEAIDRIASRMTQSGDADGIEIRPVWIDPPAHRWMGWRVAGVAGAAAVLLAVALMRMPDGNDHVVEPSVGASPLIAWAPLRAPMADTRSGGEVDEPVGAGRMRPPAVAARESAPAFGIPFLETPTALAIAPPTAMANIDVDPVAIDALEIVPLSIDAIDRDGARDSKEQ